MNQSPKLAHSQYFVPVDPYESFEAFSQRLKLHATYLRRLVFVLGMMFDSVRVGDQVNLDDVAANLARIAAGEEQLPYTTGWCVSVPVFLRVAELHHVHAEFYAAGLARSPGSPKAKAMSLWLHHNHIPYAV